MKATIKKTTKTAVAATKAAKAGKKAAKPKNGEYSIHSLAQFTGGARPKSRGKHGVPAGIGIEAAWCHVFAINAKAKTKWTEEQITNVMLANFPERESKVFRHPSSARSKYNAADTRDSGQPYKLEKMGVPCDQYGRPKFESFAYTADGEPIAHRAPVGQSSDKAKKTAKPTVAKKGLKVKKSSK